MTKRILFLVLFTFSFIACDEENGNNDTNQDQLSFFGDIYQFEYGISKSRLFDVVGDSIYSPSYFQYERDEFNRLISFFNVLEGTGENGKDVIGYGDSNVYDKYNNLIEVYSPQPDGGRKLRYTVDFFDDTLKYFELDTEFSKHHFIKNENNQVAIYESV